jgi:hypothetical protein
MGNRRWGIRFVGAGVWILAALTWGSIAHHLLGLPDLGPAMAVASVVLVMALPRPGAARSQRPETGSFVDEGHPSRP